MDAPEQLLDAFKAAAVSVTSLYKTSATAQTRAHAEGYQEALRDLIGFLDNENMGLGDGEGWRVRSWATEKISGTPDAMIQDRESEDEGDKAETSSSPELNRTGSGTGLSTVREDQMTREGMQSRGERMDSAPPSLMREGASRLNMAAPAATSAPTVTTTNPQTPTLANTTMSQSQPISINVPSQDQFTFQSSVQYPEPNLASLNISESPVSQHTAHTVAPHISRSSRGRHGSRTGSRSVGKAVVGQKRKINLTELFSLDSLGTGKDIFGSGREKRRHLGGPREGP